MSGRRVLAVLAVAFAALAVAVAAGALDAVDQAAVDHAMPGLVPSSRKPSIRAGLVPLRGVARESAVRTVADVATLPGSPLVSIALVGGCLLALWRRRGFRAALLLGLLYVAANAAEVLGKSLLVRPALHAGAVHVAAFDDSYPSGHALRTIFAALLAVALWRRALPAAFGWTAAAAVFLVVGGFHTPTDVVGGLLLGALAAAPAFARLRPPAPEAPPERHGRPAPRRSPRVGAAR